MLAVLQNAIFYVVPFLLVITVIVTIHELGHFLTARAFGVAVERFSIGFGRALLSWRDKSGIEWRVGWLPVGGYVKFGGDENAAGLPDKESLDALRAHIVAREGIGAEKKYLHFKPLWQRALVVAAGPAANFVLSIILFSILLATIGEPITPAKVARVTAGGAAEAAGFRPGDVILAADHHRLRGFEDLQNYVIYRQGVPIDFEVRRGGARLDIVATPHSFAAKTVFGTTQTAGQLGIESPVGRGVTQWVRHDPVSAVGFGAKQTWDVFSTTAFYLGRMVTGQVSVGQLHSFVGMARASGAITKDAIASAPGNLGDQAIYVVVSLFRLAAVISVSIGFLNLLPLPVLDGGHLLFYAYEGIARRPLSASVQAAGYRVGLALVVSLMLFAVGNDLYQQGLFRFLGGLFS